jgi:hypothetical protein
MQRFVLRREGNLTEEKLQFSRNLLVLGNLGLLAWVFLAFFGVFFYSQLWSWVYLAAVAFLIWGILRRLGCSSCYMCKTCTSGFGRLAGAFFGRGLVKKASVGNRLGLVAFIYALLLPVPIAFLALSLSDPSLLFFKVFVVVCLLAVSIYSFLSWRKTKS